MPTPEAQVNLWYKERLGHPTESKVFTQEYRILSNVPYRRALLYRTANNWIRAVWRFEELPNGSDGGIKIAA